MENTTTLEAVKSLYSFVETGNMDGILSVMHEDLVVLEPASLPYGGRYEGHAGFSHMVTRIGECWSSFAASEYEFIASGDAVAARFRFQAVSRKTGKQFDQYLCEIWRGKDGKLIHGEVFYFDTHAIVTGT